ncbi:MAG: hypothetical protein JWM04_1113, partial [Verrucomicrobiales bacterium]|nr:hypothetical protein [Verrucomicrobiales bacterium]
MITVPLELRHRASVLHQTVALVLPGNEPAAWLEIILSLNIPAEKLRLYLVPASRNSGNPGGLLAILPSARGAVLPGPGLPLGKLGAGLYLPVDAELYPPVAPQELDTLCRYPVMLFHPGLGLVGFEAKDEKRVSDLFSRPIYREGNWNFASPGVHLNQHIRSVSLLALTDLSQLFGGAAEEIGSDPIQQLPPNPAEPSQGKGTEFRRGLEKFIASAIAATTSKFPHIGHQRTWINDLEDWAAKRLQGINREREELRHKELHRLLRKLDEEPDDGLRHAIPMSSFANRGIAPPSNRLGSHEPNFSLGGIRGGRPVDSWSVPTDLQAQLSKKYRELAQRELKLGRYRRAAFIYAELLGDLHSAASALKQGRFYQEAAVVYRDHLKQPREAAFCLAEGGLIREAIEIYRAEKMFIEAARLYRRVGQMEEAEIEFRKAIDAKLAAGDRLAAVSFLERELGRYDEALQLLEEGWPKSTQAMACFTGFIERLGSRGEHQRAVKKAGEARSLVLGNELYHPVTIALADLALRYPDASTRVAFGDTVRLMAATALSDKPPMETAKAMLQILYRLSPQDRLLVRDGHRFLLGQREKQRAKDKIKSLPPPIPGQQEIVLITSFALPSSPR